MKRSTFVWNIMLLFLISGCSPLISASMNASVTDETVVTKTADYFGVTEEEIEVTRINKNALNTKYRTKYKNNLYNCYIQLGSVVCKIPGA